MKEHSDRLGHAVGRSTLAGVLGGPGGLRWATVDAFIDACLSYAKSRRRRLPPESADKSLWRKLFDEEITARRRDRRRTRADAEVVPAPQTPYRVGVGVLGWKGLFQVAWNDLTANGRWTGVPVSEVHQEGPGVVQVFDSPDSPFGWVMCALPYQQPVAVDGEIWLALQAVGSAVPGGDGLAALGFPLATTVPASGLRARAEEIELGGGQWGRGRLVRNGTSPTWRWEPVPRFETRLTHASRFWTGTAERAVQQLRVRSLLVLPLNDDRDLQVTADSRRELERALPVSDFARAIVALAGSRGAALTPPDWNRGPNRNALDAVSYSSRITAPDGRAALSAEVMIALPNVMNSSVAACAELRVEDLAAWSSVLTALGAEPQPDMRLSPSDLIDLYSAGWHTTAEMLAAAVIDPDRSPVWTAPPTIEFQLSAELRMDPPSTGPGPVIETYVDLSRFGSSDRGSLAQMSVTATAPYRLDDHRRRVLTRQAIEYMAQQFGFVDLPDDGSMVH